jgi:hypothetical protein
MEPMTDRELVAPKQRLRVAYLLARGHRFLRILTDESTVDESCSFTKLARACGCSKARISQIVDLTLLNYDIQEEILGMEKGKGREPITEHDLRWVVRVLEPKAQLARWDELLRRKDEAVYTPLSSTNQSLI